MLDGKAQPVFHDTALGGCGGVAGYVYNPEYDESSETAVISTVELPNGLIVDDLTHWECGSCRKRVTLPVQYAGFARSLYVRSARREGSRGSRGV